MHGLLLRGKRTFVLAAAMIAAVGCSSGGGGGGGSTSGASTATNTTQTTTATPTTTTTTGTPAANTLGTGVAFHSATILPNDRVLVAGGQDSSGQPTAVTEVVDATGNVALGPSMLQARFGHTATLLANGKILFAGGQGAGAAGVAGPTLSSTEVYDPVANTFTAGPVMSTPRMNHIAVAFGPAATQKVLIAGGSYGSTILGSAELYDTTTNTFSTLPATLAIPRKSASAGLMDDGTIIIMGGDNGTNTAGNAEIFSPTTSTFVALSMPTAPVAAAFASTGSEAVLAGGQTTAGIIQTSEIYTSSTRLVSVGPLVAIARRDAVAALVVNNNTKQVVIVGGRTNSGATGAVEIFSGPTIAGSTVGLGTSLTTPRYGHTATALSTGKLVVVGGVDTNGLPLTSVEIVTPTVLSTPTTTIGTAPAGGVALSITPVPSTAQLPTASSSSSGGLSGILGSIVGSIFGGSSGSSGGIGGILSSVLGSLFGGSSSSSSGLAPAVTSCTPGNGPAGTLVTIQASGIGSYLAVCFDNGNGSPVFLNSANCQAWTVGATVQVNLTVPAGLTPGAYKITLITSNSSTAGSPAAAATATFNVN